MQRNKELGNTRTYKTRSFYRPKRLVLVYRWIMNFGTQCRADLLTYMIYMIFQNKSGNKMFANIENGSIQIIDFVGGSCKHLGTSKSEVNRFQKPIAS